MSVLGRAAIAVAVALAMVVGTANGKPGEKGTNGW